LVEFLPATSYEEYGLGTGPQKPELRVLEATNTYGRFALEPLDRGVGITLGNPLRRVLLSAIEGVAVTWVRVDGVLHEYSTVPHMKEEILEFLQNVKALRMRPLSQRPGRMRLETTGPGKVCAADISPSADFDVVNPDLHLATLDSTDANLIVEFNVEHGKGYLPAQQENGLPIGTLPVDAIFGPVRKVNYQVEPMRLGQVIDFERLVLEVWTDGSVSPTEAVHEGAQVLVDHFFVFASVGRGVDAGKKAPVSLSLPAEMYHMRVDRLELSSRTLNCLKRSNINEVGELLEKTRADLLRIRNFGERSMEELLNRLREKELPIPETLDHVEESMDEEPALDASSEPGTEVSDTVMHAPDMSQDSLDVVLITSTPNDSEE